MRYKDPDGMTTEERMRELAAIFAAGILRLRLRAGGLEADGGGAEDASGTRLLRMSPKTRGHLLQTLRNLPKALGN